MIKGAKYKCKVTLKASNRPASFLKGHVYVCKNVTEDAAWLINEQGEDHGWAMQQGYDRFAHLKTGWEDNWTDFFEKS